LENQGKLERNRGRLGGSSTPQPERKQLLLTGMLLCGRCGRRMYGVYRGSQKLSGIYECKGELDTGQGKCWSVQGAPIDDAVEQLFLQTAVAGELALGIAVDQQVDKQAEALAQQWRVRIEKAGYEARRAERRYKAVDPDNRVVARTLEREWEECLRELDQVERDYERAKSEARVHLTEQERARIRELSSDLRQVWNAPTTKQADRKAMLALVIEAITLHPVDIPIRNTRVSLQWKAGAVDELQVRRPSSSELQKPPPQAVARMSQLAAEGQHDTDIARQLNAEGYTRRNGQNWTKISVGRARGAAKIEKLAPVRYAPVKAPPQLPDGTWTVAGTAERYQVSHHVVRRWIKLGLIPSGRQQFANYPHMLSLTIDEQTDQRLKAIRARKTQNS